MEPHGAVWRLFKLSLEMHGAAWSRMELHMLGAAWSRLEQHGATVSTLNTTGAVWRPFKLGLEMHGAAWSRMELQRAAWNHCVNFKYYRSRMETLLIRSRDAWSCMEQQGATV